MSLSVDDFWTSFHNASKCAGKALEIRRTVEIGGDLIEVLDSLDVDEMSRISESIEAVRPYLVPAIPQIASYGGVMAASWHHAVYSCLLEMLRLVMDACGTAREEDWYDGSLTRSERERWLQRVPHALTAIRQTIVARFPRLDDDLKTARWMLYKEMAIAWQAYTWECALGITSGPAESQVPGQSISYSHGPDFRSVIWNGKPFSFTRRQAGAVQILWEAWKNGTPEVGQDYILQQIGADVRDLRDVFRDHKAWGVMIVNGQAGIARLNLQHASERSAERA